eukprot:121600-Pyramimonas_sp.AAC.1
MRSILCPNSRRWRWGADGGAELRLALETLDFVAPVPLVPARFAPNIPRCFAIASHAAGR